MTCTLPMLLAQDRLAPAANRTWEDSLPRLAWKTDAELPDTTPARLTSRSVASFIVQHDGTQRRRLDEVTKLFDAVLDDPELPQPIIDLLSGLRDPALRVALVDESLELCPHHPLWRIVDRMAFIHMVLGADDRGRSAFIRCAARLVARIREEQADDVSLYDWALGELAIFERQLLARHMFTALSGSRSSTVGREGNAPDVRPTAGMLSETGRWLQLWLQGQWREVQLIWHDPASQTILCRAWQDGHVWRLRLPLLERWTRDGLARAWNHRSLVQRAMLRRQASVRAWTTTRRQIARCHPADSAQGAG